VGWYAYFLSRYSAQRKAEIKADRPGNGPVRIIMFVSRSPLLAELARRLICISAKLNRCSARIMYQACIFGRRPLPPRGVSPRFILRICDNLNGKLFAGSKLLGSNHVDRTNI